MAQVLSVTSAPFVDAHVNALDMSALKAQAQGVTAPAHAALDPGAVLATIGTVYHAIRPIFVALMWIPFIPKKWKDALTAFQRLMDALYPTAP